MNEELIFEYLDDLRESGTINMMGAPLELQAEFGLDKIEAREIFQLWTEKLKMKS
jgi:hypothetical protein